MMVRDSSLRIVVTGLIAQHPRLGGITWHYLQYVLGLARLGHDVFYVEDSGEVPYNVTGGASGDDWTAKDCAANVAHLSGVMTRFGLEGRWAYHNAPTSQWHGLPDARRRDVIASADLLLNVSGSLEHPKHYRAIPRLAYIDTDPVVTQAKVVTGWIDFRPRVVAHDVHFSFGERFTGIVPDTGHTWLPTRQPIVLSEWSPADATRDAFTTVMSWTSYAPLRWKGLVFGQKDVEFQRFVDLPRRVAPVPLEVAMSPTPHLDWQADEMDQTPRDRLTRAGWRVADADATCGDLDAYRDYIRSSRAEWSVAKNAYVQGRPAWFSERSACYLASGRPVVVQDAGFGAVLPVGEGLLSFETPQQAAEAVREVDRDHARHARAARAIAEAYFDSDEVLTKLIDT
ncbi:MAG: hypothetical protein ACYTES_15955, partial [Planctomycetota bacterium]